jgi:quinol monooxygenase YgiN
MPPYSLHSRLPTTSRSALVDLLARAADLLSDDPDCYLYLIHHDVEDEACVWVTELWRDRAAHDASLEREDVRALIREAGPLLSGTPEQTRMEAVAGKGLPRL